MTGIASTNSAKTSIFQQFDYANPWSQFPHIPTLGEFPSMGTPRPDAYDTLTGAKLTRSSIGLMRAE